MEMLTPNALRQGGALSLLECLYSLPLPEDRPVEQQEGHGKLFYKSQDRVRLSVVISTYLFVGSFCSGGQFLILVPLRTPQTALAAQVPSPTHLMMPSCPPISGNSGQLQIHFPFMEQMEKANGLHII